MKRIVFLVLSLCLCVSVLAQTPEELFKMANEYWNNKNYEKYVEYSKKAAEGGHAKAAYVLGIMYWQGLHVELNYKTSRYWWEKATDNGDKIAPFMLGLMYNLGDGVRQDLKAAKEWYGRACDNGNQDGCEAYRQMNGSPY